MLSFLLASRKGLFSKTKSISNPNKSSFQHNSNFYHSIKYNENPSNFNQISENQEIQRMIKSRIIQPKLKISQPNDPYEREADRVADQIMRMSNIEDKTHVQNNSENKIQRKCSSCQMNDKKKDELKISRKPTFSNNDLETTDEISNQIKNTDGGKPLDNTTKSFMESRFGYDFSDVRIHDDSKSQQLSRSVNARAFTVGNNVFLGQNEFTSDNRLIAHELTHVLQQNTNDRKLPLNKMNTNSVQNSLQPNKNEPISQITTNNNNLALTIQRSLREDMNGQWNMAAIELNTIYSSAGGIIGRQKHAVHTFTEAIKNEDPPSITDQILIGGINLLLNAALGGIATVLKSVALRALRPALRTATRGTMGTAVDSSQVRRVMRSSVTQIIDSMKDAGKARISSAVSAAWRGAANTSENRALQFRETQMSALDDIARAQTQAMNSGLSRLRSTEGEDDEWGVANALYESFQQSISSAYAEQFNKMTDLWFTMQTQSIGLGARPGVLQIELYDRYPHQGNFRVESANLLGEGSVSTVRNRLAQRKLKDIAIPKVIRMNGSMGYGILDCKWYIDVTGMRPRSRGPSISAPSSGTSALMAGPQRVTNVRQNSRWGLAWLAAFNLGLNDLDNGDRRNSATNQVRGAFKVWDEIKNMTPNSIGASTW